MAARSHSGSHSGTPDLALSLLALAQAEQAVRLGHWPDWPPSFPLTEADGWWVVALPTMLFFHDHLGKQRYALGQAAEANQVGPADELDVVAYAYAIAQALKTQLEPHSFSRQLSSYLQVSQPTAARGLASPEYLWGAELDQWRNGQGGVALALYSFLTTPDSMALGVKRAIALAAAQPQINPIVLGALVGGLFGAYNGVEGIPSLWVAGLTQQCSSLSPTTIDTVARGILALWSGVYAPLDLNGQPLAVSPPWVSRSRR
jgi:hypothetical protein